MSASVSLLARREFVCARMLQVLAQRQSAARDLVPGHGLPHLLTFACPGFRRRDLVSCGTHVCCSITHLSHIAISFARSLAL
jgi:hypothetical protein